MFVGQKDIVKNLETLYIPAINAGKKVAPFLFVASAGMGKTELALQVLGKCGANKDNAVWVTDCDDAVKLLKYFKNEKYKFIFIDEAHTIKKNHEVLYPYMVDTDKVILFATNLTGNLPDAFISRCTMFFFMPYSLLELETLIDRHYSKKTGEAIKFFWLSVILVAGGGNPRLTLKILDTCILKESIGYTFETKDSLKSFIKESFGIEDGLSELQRQIIRVLETLPDSRASLSTMSHILKVDEGTIKRERALLVSKGIIGIGAKGMFLLESRNDFDAEY